MAKGGLGIHPRRSVSTLSSVSSSSRSVSLSQAVAAPSSASTSPALSSDRSISSMQQCRLITAVKTPYSRRNGKIDMAAYDSILRHQVECGVEGVIVGGTTGEGQLMSWDEHIMLIAHTVNMFGNKLVVIGNTGSNSTREAIHATEQGFNVGMHASLQINPYYGKTSDVGVIGHLSKALDLGPAIVYNVPARTSQDIKPETMHVLADHENFLGVKECEGDERIAGYAERGIAVWSGNDDECHDSRYKAGATGVISVSANAVPELFHKLMHDGDDQDLNASLQPLISWIFQEPNPIGINTLMAMLGACEPVFRLPYVPLDLEQRRKGVKLLSELGVGNCPGGGSIRELADEDFELIAQY